MPSDFASPLGPLNIDIQLVAAVQCSAGARCHESANLLNSYQLWAQIYQRAMKSKDNEEARGALHMVQDSEVNLRKFLFQCRSPGGRCDCPHAQASGRPPCGEQ